MYGEIAITATIIENPSFYSDIRLFGLPSYTSVVVINVWLCCLTGYVLRRRKKSCFDHGSSEERRGRMATGRSQESSEIEKLSRSIWYGSRSSVWLTKRIHDTWKVVKGISSFNFDLIFDSDSEQDGF